MICRPLIAVLALALAAPVLAAKSSLRVLDRSVRPVASAFNEHTDRARFIAVLSPT
jgi:hypothetical protein